MPPTRVNECKIHADSKKMMHRNAALVATEPFKVQASRTRILGSSQTRNQNTGIALK